MAENGSVAPKERVNIVYKPATGDAKEEVELPLKQLVIGDFTSREDNTPLEQRKPVTVDKSNFNEVLKAQRLTLEFTVPDQLSAPQEGATEPATLPVRLAFNALSDFEPDAIVEQVPELRQLIALREAMKALKGPLGNLPEFRRHLQELVQDEGVRAQLLAELGVRQDPPVSGNTQPEENA